MSINAKFEDAIVKLDAVRQEILRDESLLPITFRTSSGEETISYDSLNGNFESLSNEPFTIAICGEVKAGKSTLLNAILFGDDVLPTFDTPLTAKLTFIKKSEKPYNYFRVNFYNTEEWETVRESLEPSALADLNKKMQIAMERFGISKANCVEKISISREVNDLQELDQYVSAMKVEDESSKAGCYTAYVKNVEIFINDERLHNLQIVDTPGLNDPNAINSHETTCWINNAHAIVYIVAVQGFNQPDLQFFEQFMNGRGPKFRVIVQNKIDTEPDHYQESLAYMKSLGTKLEYRKIDLFSNEETICSYSGKQALLAKKQKAGIPLTEDDEYYLLENFDYDPDNLELTIGNKLFANEGAGRIPAISGVLQQVYSLNILKIESEMVENDLMQEELQKDLSEIEKDLENVQDIRIKFDNEEKQIQECLGGKIKEIRSTVDHCVNDFFKSLNKDFEKKIGALMREGNFKTVLGRFSSYWEERFNDTDLQMTDFLNSHIEKFMGEIKDSCRSVIEKLKSVLQKNVIESFFYSEDDSSWIENSSILEGLKYGEVMPSNAFTNLFYKNSRLTDEIIGVVSKDVSEIFDKRYRGLGQACQETMKNRLNAYLGYINEKLDVIEKKLENAKTKQKNKETELSKIAISSTSLKMRRDELEKKLSKLRMMTKELEIC